MNFPAETVDGVPLIHTFFDSDSATWTYVVVDRATLCACIIDPVLPFDPATDLADADSLRGLADFVRRKAYRVERIIETHVHADHLSGAAVLKALLPNSPPTYIGERVSLVQKKLGLQYDFDETSFEGSFDGFLSSEEGWHLGTLEVRNLPVPGHTPDGMAIIIGDAVFVGDSLLPPELGTARCDFPGGSADVLWSSAQKVLGLHDEMKVFSAHDYPSEAREKRSHASVAEHKRMNIHVKDGSDLETFAQMRRTRDANLSEPRLLKQSLRVNLRGGRLSGGLKMKPPGIGA